MITFHQGPSGSGQTDSSTSSSAVDARNQFRADLGFESWDAVLRLKEKDSLVVAEIAKQVKTHSAALSASLALINDIFSKPETKPIQSSCYYILDLLETLPRPFTIDLSYAVAETFELYEKINKDPNLRAALPADIQSQFAEALVSIRHLIELFPRGENQRINIKLAPDKLLATQTIFEKAKSLAEDFVASDRRMQQIQEEFLLSGVARYVPTNLLQSPIEPIVEVMRVVSAEDAAKIVGQSRVEYAFFAAILCACIIKRERLTVQSLLSRLEDASISLQKTLNAQPRDALQLHCWRIKGGEYPITHTMNQDERNFVLLAACLKLQDGCPPEAKATLKSEIKKTLSDLAQRDESVLKRTAQSLTKMALVSKLECNTLLELIRQEIPPERKRPRLSTPSEEPAGAEATVDRFLAKLGADAIKYRSSEMRHALVSSGWPQLVESFSQYQSMLIVPTDPQEYSEYLEALSETLKKFSDFFANKKQHALHPQCNPLAYSSLRLTQTNASLHKDQEEALQQLQVFCVEYLQITYGYSIQTAQEVAEQLSIEKVEARERALAEKIKLHSLPVKPEQLLAACPQIFNLREDELPEYSLRLARHSQAISLLRSYYRRSESDAISLGVDTTELNHRSSMPLDLLPDLQPGKISETTLQLESIQSEFDQRLVRKYLALKLNLTPQAVEKFAASLSFFELQARAETLRGLMLEVAPVGNQKTTRFDLLGSFSRANSIAEVLFLPPRTFNEYCQSLSELFSAARSEAPHFLSLRSPEQNPAAYAPQGLRHTWQELNAVRLAELGSNIKSDREYDAKITVALLRKLLLQLDQHERLDVRQSSLTEAIQRDLGHSADYAIRSQINHLARHGVIDVRNNRVSLRQAPTEFSNIMHVLRSELKWGRLAREHEQSIQIDYMKIKFADHEDEHEDSARSILINSLHQAQAWVHQDKYPPHLLTILAAVDAEASAQAPRAWQIDDLTQRVFECTKKAALIEPDLSFADVKLLIYKLRNFEHLQETALDSERYLFSANGYEHSINHLTKVVREAHRVGLLQSILI